MSRDLLDALKRIQYTEDAIQIVERFPVSGPVRHRQKEWRLEHDHVAQLPDFDKMKRLCLEDTRRVEY